MSQDLATLVVDGLDKEDPNILRASCIMAGVLGLEQAERGLIKALGHKAWQIQAEAARSLGRLGSQGAIPYLRRLLKASDADVRQKLLAAAAAGGKGPAEEGEGPHPEVLHQAALALNRLQPKITEEALLAALDSDQPKLLSAAMAGLASLDSQSGRAREIELLSHSDAAVRQAACACLGRLRAQEAVPGLLDCLQDPEAEVRKEAVIALNHIKDVKGLEPLAECMEDKSPEVRRVAAIALGNTRSRGQGVVLALTRALEDRDPNVRKAALSALANIKAPEPLEKAALLLGDTHEEVARQAAVTVTALAQARERPEYQFEVC